jgi:rhamnogalacturonan endolyase
MTIRYASGSADQVNRYMELFVNNVSYGIVTFPPTANWITWDSVTVQVSLKEGINMIKMSSLDENGGPNMDEFEFAAEGITLYTGDVNPNDLIVEISDESAEDSSKVKKENDTSKEKDVNKNSAPEGITISTTVPLINAASAIFDMRTGTLYATRAGFATVSVYNMSGRLVAKFAGNVRAGENWIDIKQANLPKGHYRTTAKFR